MEPAYDLNVEAIENPKSIVQSWLGTILYCGFIFPFFAYALLVWRDPIAILGSGFFALWGVAMIAFAIRMTASQRAFGTVNLLLERPGPSIGGRLVGSIRLPRSALRAGTVSAELSCTKETHRMDSDGGESQEPIWAGKKAFPIHAKADAATVSIAIDIPGGLEPTTPKPEWLSMKTGDPPRVFWVWSLRITADVPGADLDRNYLITVLAPRPGAAAAPAPAVQAAPVAEYETQVKSRTQPPDGSSLWVLIAANLVAIPGAIFWGWAVQDIVFLYWMENLVIGAFNVGRILFAEPDRTEQIKRGFDATAGELFLAKAMFAAFFLVHYGGFCFGHGEFLVSMFPGVKHASGLFAAIAEVLRERGMLLALLAIVVSHGYSFFRNYLGRRECDGVDFRELMTRPYKRIFVTHIFILAGGFTLEVLKLPVAAMVVFIAIKIGADVYFHRAERDAFSAPPATA